MASSVEHNIWDKFDELMTRVDKLFKQAFPEDRDVLKTLTCEYDKHNFNVLNPATNKIFCTKCGATKVI